MYHYFASIYHNIVLNSVRDSLLTCRELMWGAYMHRPNKGKQRLCANLIVTEVNERARDG